MWRADLDALEFTPEGHCGRCVVHRLALRRFVAAATPGECLAFFAARKHAFEAAATRKIGLRSLPSGAHFHLTSRDIAFQLARAV